ncbi:MAG TPA: hypothetical protein VN033_13310 [Vulgatibacter sp.]|nr:hypothetical protein [Vulgatibacter sp.]
MSPKRRFIAGSAVALVLGIAGLVLGALLDPRRFLFSYLTAWAFWVSTAIGALFVVMIGHAARARWFAGVRRLMEYPTSTLPLLLLLAIPIFLGLDSLYEWAGPWAALPEAKRRLLEHKRLWLNEPFFVVRSVVYLLVLSAFSHLLVAGSLREDAGYDEARKRRLQRIGSGGIPICALVATWASFDWLMSLEPTWYSTVFGVYFWAGGFIAALSLLGILVAVFAGLRLLPPEIGPAHQWATGRLMFAFVIFWAYQGFSQLLIIWIGNIPNEISFYQHRANTGWGWVSFLLGVGQFLVPFLLLLSRDLKRKPAALAWMGAWLLFAHYVDVYWMVIPNLHPEGVVVSWLDLAALLGTGGALGLFTALRFAGRPTVPVGDPYYLQSLTYGGHP